MAGRSSSPFAGRSWYDFALEYLDVRWRQTAAKTRCEDNDGLCALTLAMIRGRTLRPDEELLRRALRRRAFVVPRPADREVPGDERMALRWVARATRPVDDLLDPEVMKGVIQSLSVRADGSAVPGSTQRYCKKALVNAVGCAFGGGGAGEDLVPEIRWQVPADDEEVDP
ncbi:hypothetical protein ACFZAM_10400 [Streptomyces sp. NPDC008079]|uniref:hypothetical protein n=1 Tax=Streptomyces sp. NPDC008079 TaxID=3364806 RepID=UPI0036F1051C